MLLVTVSGTNLTLMVHLLTQFNAGHLSDHLQITCRLLADHVRYRTFTSVLNNTCKWFPRRERQRNNKQLVLTTTYVMLPEPISFLWRLKSDLFQVTKISVPLANNNFIFTKSAQRSTRINKLYKTSKYRENPVRKGKFLTDIMLLGTGWVFVNNFVSFAMNWVLYFPMKLYFKMYKNLWPVVSTRYCFVKTTWGNFLLT